MIPLRTFLFVAFFLHQGVVTLARIDNSFGETTDQQSNKIGGPVAPMAPKEPIAQHRGHKGTFDAADAYKCGFLDGVALTLIFVSLTLLIGCVGFLLAIYYSKGYAYLKRIEKARSANLESVKVDQRK